MINAYIAAGVPSTKINLGMPLYGRAFTNTAGLGQPYKGVGKGTWEAGVYDFKDLPLPGAKEYFDNEAYATYSYDNKTEMLVTYDTVNMALTKVGYIKQKKLGGAMWWEVSGDRNDSGSIISNVSILPIHPCFILHSVPVGQTTEFLRVGREPNVRRRWQGHRVEAELDLLSQLSVLKCQERVLGVSAEPIIRASRACCHPPAFARPQDPQRSDSRSAAMREKRKRWILGPELAFMQHVLYSNVVNNCCDMYVHESFCCQAETSRANDANHSSVRGWRLKACQGSHFFSVPHGDTRAGRKRQRFEVDARMPDLFSVVWGRAMETWDVLSHASGSSCILEACCARVEVQEWEAGGYHFAAQPQVPASSSNSTGQLGIILCSIGSLKRSA